MPQMGYGVYQVTPEECERCVMDAISVGYRMIDTAQAYHNEAAVGKAWKKSGVSRDELFLVSKVWISNYGEGQTMKSIDESLRKLQTDHIDLMLLHQPFCDRYGAYRDLEKAYKAGKLRAIGVSNFYPDHLIDLASNVEIAPMVNQVETHVFNQQIEARQYMKEWQRDAMDCSPTQCSHRLARSTARRWHRWLCAGCCRLVSSSFQRVHTRSVWRRTFSCSTLSWIQRTCRPSHRSTPSTAFSSTITMVMWQSFLWSGVVL